MSSDSIETLASVELQYRAAIGLGGSGTLRAHRLWAFEDDLGAPLPPVGSKARVGFKNSMSPGRLELPARMTAVKRGAMSSAGSGYFGMAAVALATAAHYRRPDGQRDRAGAPATPRGRPSRQQMQATPAPYAKRRRDSGEGENRGPVCSHARARLLGGRGARLPEKGRRLAASTGRAMMLAVVVIPALAIGSGPAMAAPVANILWWHCLGGRRSRIVAGLATRLRRARRSRLIWRSIEAIRRGWLLRGSRIAPMSPWVRCLPGFR